MLLPDENAVQNLIKNASVIVGRLLVHYIPAFSKFIDVIESHINHKYSHEMAQKSIVVSHNKFIK